jgi:hypothetical protein
LQVIDDIGATRSIFFKANQSSSKGSGKGLHGSTGRYSSRGSYSGSGWGGGKGRHGSTGRYSGRGSYSGSGWGSGKGGYGSQGGYGKRGGGYIGNDVSSRRGSGGNTTPRSCIEAVFLMLIARFLQS